MSERSMSPTVFGIENEYTCTITLPGGIVHELVGQCHSPDAELGLYQQPTNNGSAQLPKGCLKEALEAIGLYSNANGMLSNGARFYLDPSGPEYDTPETQTAAEAVERSFDGDAVVLSVFEHLRRSDIITGYQFNRRIVDHNRSSRGVHLNTSTSLPNRENPDQKVKNILATLNVVKGAMFGSGGLLIDEEGNTDFHHSPRLSLTTDHSAPFGEYQKRPLVRYPFKSDGALHGRIETVTSDALNFAWPLRASLVATNALVKAIELGYGDKFPLLMDPVASAHDVGRFGNDTMIGVVNEDGEADLLRPLDVLRDICEIILAINDFERHLDKESYQVLPEIIDLADKMSEDMYAGINQVESVTRLAAMDRRMTRGTYRLGLDSERMCRYDYAWDLLGGGIAEKLRNQGVGWQGFGRSPSHQSPAARLVTPPQDTRAKVRGDLIKETRGQADAFWPTIELAGAVLYIHPLSTERPGR